MSETFWNFLGLGVVVFVYVIIYLHKRRCRKRNIAFTKPFAGMEKYEKRISKAMDYFLITIILLANKILSLLEASPKTETKTE